MTSRTIGLCQSVDGFLRNHRYPRDYRGVFQDAKGRTLSPEEARASLEVAKANGWKVIPCHRDCSAAPCKNASRGCTGFDYQRGCPGYLTPERTVGYRPPDEAYRDAVNRLCELAGRGDGWNQRFRDGLEQLGLELGAEPARGERYPGGVAYQAQIPMPGDPDPWPTPSYLNFKPCLETA